MHTLVAALQHSLGCHLAEPALYLRGQEGTLLFSGISADLEPEAHSIMVTHIYMRMCICLYVCYFPAHEIKPNQQILALVRKRTNKKVSSFTSQRKQNLDACTGIKDQRPCGRMVRESGSEKVDGPHAKKKGCNSNVH